MDVGRWQMDCGFGHYHADPLPGMMRRLLPRNKPWKTCWYILGYMGVTQREVLPRVEKLVYKKDRMVAYTISISGGLGVSITLMVESVSPMTPA
jgi:hypothetical protein